MLVHTAVPGRRVVLRTLTHRLHVVGPKHDPYLQEWIIYAQRFADGSSRTVTVVTCALEEGMYLLLDGERVMPRLRWDASILEALSRRRRVTTLFQELTGLSYARAVKIVAQRQQHDESMW